MKIYNHKVSLPLANSVVKLYTSSFPANAVLTDVLLVDSR